MTLESYWVRVVQLTSLWAYGVSQPILSFVGGNPELLVLRGATRTEIVAFALLLSLGPPVAAIAYVALASALSKWVGDVLFVIALSVFLVPVAAHFLPPTEIFAVLTVAALCAAGVTCYLRFRALRLFLTFSIVLPVFAFAAFVWGAPIATSKAAPNPATVSSPVPVVLVVFDEFPVSALMTNSNSTTIDATRYPNFAALARDGTWYPRATTVHDFTAEAVPAIVTGRRSPTNSLPVVADYPQNLFTLLGGSYFLRVYEPVTFLCPEEYCTRSRGSFVHRVGSFLTEISSTYVNVSFPSAAAQDVADLTFREVFHASAGSRVQAFDDFLHGLSPAQPANSLHYFHFLLPHSPYMFLPSGHTYAPTSMEGFRAREAWGDDAWLVLQGYQRLLLQVGYADALVGRLTARLKETGLWDRALVVLVADHGVSFRPGGARRTVTKENFADISNVPLFVKYPGQSEGTVDTRSARIIDILPTVTDVLGVRTPWRVEGVSLRATPPERRDALVTGSDGSVTRLSMSSMIRKTRETVARKEAWFGRGHDSLYRIGSNRALVDAVVPRTWTSSESVRVRIENEDVLVNLRPGSNIVPGRISGVVEEGQLSPRTELAIAVNGRVRALTRAFTEAGRQRFRALVPESSFGSGFNRVEVFAVATDRGKTRFVRLGASRLK